VAASAAFPPPPFFPAGAGDGMTVLVALAPVSTTPEANFATVAAGVVDPGGKFATGFNDTGQRHGWQIMETLSVW
jgi:hypothetical protein